MEHTIEEHDCFDKVHDFTIADSRVEGVTCAFVKLKSGQQCELDQLKAFLAIKLTDYILPEHIQFVDEFHPTSIGKMA